MDALWLSSLIKLAIVCLFTPGPNNIMLATSGVNFGLKRTLPHICGVAFGFILMMFPIVLGLSKILTLLPGIHLVIKTLGIGALLWLAWRIARADQKGGVSCAKPFTLLEAVIFQWVNPKAWAVSLSVGATYVTGTSIWLEAFWICTVFALTGVFSALTWVYFGMAMRRFLKSPRSLRIFNVSMAALVVLCIVQIV